MKKTLIFALMFSAVTLTAMSQTTITGKVTSKKDGSPIMGALITIKENPETSATTDVTGAYSINVPEGGKVLTCTATGWAPKTNGIGNKKTINFEMTSEADDKESGKLEKVKGGKAEKARKGKSKNK